MLPVGNLLISADDPKRTRALSADAIVLSLIPDATPLKRGVGWTMKGAPRDRYGVEAARHELDVVVVGKSGW